eukprot:SAG11_NODE_1425_length_4944_cov_3.856966_1_plen_120_part_00
MSSAVNTIVKLLPISIAIMIAFYLRYLRLSSPTPPRRHRILLSPISVRTSLEMVICLGASSLYSLSTTASTATTTTTAFVPAGVCANKKDIESIRIRLADDICPKQHPKTLGRAIVPTK